MAVPLANSMSNRRFHLDWSDQLTGVTSQSRLFVQKFACAANVCLYPERSFRSATIQENNGQLTDSSGHPQKRKRR